MNKSRFPLDYSEIISVLVPHGHSAPFGYTDCEVIAEGSGKEITGVAIDSRTAEEGCIFFALHGERSDGHRFVAELAEKAACCVIDTVDSRIEEILSECSCMIIKTENTLSSLQKLAEYYRSKFKDLFMIGITGSSGKTTTKELTAAVLAGKAPTVMNKGNLNSEIGLPLSVFSIRDCHRYGVFEMGMNRAGEMDILIDVLKPEFGIITNIGTAHIGILGSQDKIAEEKSKIFLNNSSFKSGLIYSKDSYAENIASITGNKVKLYDAEHLSGIISIEDKGISGSVFHFDKGDISLKLIGPYNVQNAAAAIKTAEELSVDFSDIKKGVESVTALFGRGEIHEGAVTVISECYNANMESVFSAVDFLENIDWKGRKAVLLGSILELGDKSEEIHSIIGRKISESLIDAAFFFGEEAESAFKAADSREGDIFLFHTSDNNEMEKKLVEFLSDGDLILFKGSRGIALEQFIKPVLGSVKRGEYA